MYRSDLLDLKNRYVLNVVQASLGLISRHVIAIALKLDDSSLLLRFWVYNACDQIYEDIDDIIFDLDALLLPEGPEIRTEVITGKPKIEPDEMGRLIFWAKDEDGSS